MKLFFRIIWTFIKLMWKYPLDIRENIDDCKTIYYFATDPELKDLNKRIENL